MSGAMHPQAGQAHHWRALLAGIAILLAAAACGTLPPATPSATLSRLDAIPPGAVKYTPADDAHPPILHVDEWEQPAPLDAPVNTAGAEDSPFILPDGSRLFFFFTPDLAVPAEKQLLDGVTGIYVSDWSESGWSEPQRVQLGEPGKLALDGCPTVAGDVFWFCSAREGYADINLFTAAWKDGTWQDVQYAGDLLKGYQVGELHISADGSEMYFHSLRAGGAGGMDIWLSRWTGGEWGEPENVAAVNSPENDGWPFVSQDGSALWLTRTHLGTPALFRSQRVDGGWSEPELMVSQFAGEAALDAAGNLYFIHHFFKDGKMVEADIYLAKKK